MFYVLYIYWNRNHLVLNRTKGYKTLSQARARMEELLAQQEVESAVIRMETEE
jgi:hypothetical protein